MTTYDTLEVSFGFMFPNTCPQSLQDMPAGTISEGVFTPAGSVARYFFERERHSRKPEVQHVYFIQSVQGGPIKIGLTRDVDKRLYELQSAHPYPLKILKVWDSAGRAAELALHQRFASDRLCGEWFEESLALLEAIYAS